jgi:integrase
MLQRATVMMLIRGCSYLTEHELDALNDLDLSKQPRLRKARDLFLLGAWTGLRFHDLSTLNDQHIDSDRIRIRSNKTGRRVVIPLHPMVREILARNGGVPSPISNQKLNAYIKEVGAMVPSLSHKIAIGITKGGILKEIIKPKYELISTHTARRSFASNLYRQGHPAHSIMAITGHRTEGAFLRYIRLEAEEHADLLAVSPLFTRSTRPL